MKNHASIAIGFLFAISPMVITTSHAQGTMYFSNLGAAPVGSAAIASDSWIAQTFITGTNGVGYVVNSVQLLMTLPSGSPSGIEVSIYTPDGDARLIPPQRIIGSLVGSDPTSAGIYSFASSGITLSPSTWYFLVARATTPSATGSFNWSATGSLRACTSLFQKKCLYFVNTIEHYAGDERRTKALPERCD